VSNRQESVGEGGRLGGVPTFVRDPQPAEFDAVLEQRRARGNDLLDEVCEGIYHMNPAPNRRYAYVVQQVAELLGPLARAAGLVPMMSIFNLGEARDYRVPDGGLFQPGPDAVYVPTAALVLEVVSPDDETWEKVGFYSAHGVGELLIVDPQKRRVDWLTLSGEQYEPVERSGLIECGPAGLGERIDWPR
jgi:Uma2 family endonuclease